MTLKVFFPLFYKHSDSSLESFINLFPIQCWRISERILVYSCEPLSAQFLSMVIKFTWIQIGIPAFPAGKDRNSCKNSLDKGCFCHSGPSLKSVQPSPPLCLTTQTLHLSCSEPQPSPTLFSLPHHHGSFLYQILSVSNVSLEFLKAVGKEYIYLKENSSILSLSSSTPKLSTVQPRTTWRSSDIHQCDWACSLSKKHFLLVQV